METSVKGLILGDEGDVPPRTKHRLHVVMMQGDRTNQQIKEDIEKRFDELRALKTDQFSIMLEDVHVIVSPNTQAPYENKNTDIIVQFYTNLKDRSLLTPQLCLSWCALTKLFLERQPYLSFMDKDAHYLQADCENRIPRVASLSMGSFLNAGMYNSYWNMYDEHLDTIFNGDFGNIQVLFMHNKKIIEIVFDVMEEGRSRRTKLVFRYASLDQIILDMCPNDTINNNNIIRLYFTFKYAPQIHRGMEDSRPNSREKYSGYIRVLQLYTGANVQVGKCNAFCITMPDINLSSLSYGDRIGDCKTIREQLFNTVGRLKSRCGQPIQIASIFFRPVESTPGPALQVYPQIGNFPIDYALQALLLRGYSVTEQLIPEGQDLFLKCVEACARKNAEMTERALHQLLAAWDEGRRIHLWKAFWIIYQVLTGAFDQLNAEEQELDRLLQPMDIPHNCVMVRKVICTPLTQRFQPPEVMMKNRVIRTFGEEKALRVVFRDETEKLREHTLFDSKNPMAKIYASKMFVSLISRPMLNGIDIGGLLFEFLGWSNSQMRDNGCYMYAPAEHRHTHEVFRVEDIRLYMGDFRQINSIPKLMSRMGQCFTQAMDSIKLDDDVIDLEDDIIGGNINPETKERYTFTDGIGRISVKAAKRIQEKLQLEIMPSAYQIRFRGYKGMVVIDPDLDVNPNGKLIVFRKSMKKFEGTNTQHESALEIVKYAMPSPVYFNRQLVMIIDQVTRAQSGQRHDSVCRRLRQLLEIDLFSLADMLLSENESALALTERVPMKIDFERLKRSGIRLTSEPYFRGMLLAMHKFKIKVNLSKVKVELPVHLGRTMFGVVDDTGTLMYGQVFIQYSPKMKRPQENSKIIEGPVLVTKNPSVHPGDVRRLEAIDVPGLRHLHDVIVFPRYGERPHPDEMAGSDLDGDEYSVFWDLDIMFDYNVPPMHFPKVKGEPDREMHKEGMINFFIKYMRLDTIGKVANAHLAQADKLGIFSDVCNSIARKCSLAVDFCKTGVPATDLEQEENPKKSPDFMRQGHKPSYRSSFLLGYMHRVSQKVEELVEVGQTSLKVVKMDPDLETFNWRNYERNAEKELKRYRNSVQSLLDTYGIEDESSLVSGHMSVVKNRIQDGEKDSFNYFNTEKLIEMRYAVIMNNHRLSFFKEFGGEDEDYLDAPTEAIRDKASAWYQVTYRDAEIGEEGISGRLLGLPWIVWEVLANIKMTKLYESGYISAPIDPLLDLLNKTIEDNRNIKQYVMRRLKRAHPMISDYCTKYHGLESLIAVVINWVQNERLFDERKIEQYHIAFLLIDFGKESREDDLPAFLPPLDSEIHQFDISHLLASYLLQFLKYLASDTFRHQKVLKLGGDNGEEMVLRNGEWMALNIIAFKAYHHVALTGQFSSIYLAQENEDKTSDVTWDFGEMDPIVIEFPPENGRRDELETLLKDWSGVAYVHTKIDSFRRNEQLWVMATGSLASRHKLRKILLNDQLLEFVQNKQSPLQLIDFDY